MEIKQTAGREALNDFAPKFAALNDDVLFGEVWSGDGLNLKTRSIITVCVLVSKGLCIRARNGQNPLPTKNIISFKGD